MTPFTQKKNSQKETPLSLHYRMPAEWEPHEGTWLSWPKNPITWPEQIKKIEEIFAHMIEILTVHEKVFLLVNDEKSEKEVREKLKTRSIHFENLILYKIPTGDAWIRDYGPNFLMREAQQERELAFNHWMFNAWGEKYKASMSDTQVPQHLSAILKTPVFEPGIILEGGSIDVNGQGVCLTTEQCLLAPTRNPHLKKNQIEDYLKNYLGLSNVIWLGQGITGDDTDGHVDDIARFVSPNTVVCAVEENPSDENYACLMDNFNRLKSATNAQGEKLRVIPLPMPGPISYKGERLPASYANFYIANNVALVPIFRHAHDERALDILQKLFSNREVIGIPCNDLVVGHGTIHCVTQQQPKIQSSDVSHQS